MNRIRRTLLIACLTLGALPAWAATPLTVFAAASLKETLDEAAVAFEREHGVPIKVSYSASSALARQIENAAPADVFVSADLDWMDALQREGLIDARTRRNVAGNSLVLIAPASSSFKRIPLRRSVNLLPALGTDGRLALALTASVPAGRYGRAAMESLGAWTAVQPRVVEAENVRAALQLVARGEAGLGIVYDSDALVEPKVRVVGRFSPELHPPIVYPAARVTSSSHPKTRTFVAWLASPKARAMFKRHGFTLPN